MSARSLRTASRSQMSVLPSRDQAKRKMRPDLKLVICCGGPPSTGCRQTFEAPLRMSTYISARPSSVQ